MWGGLALPEIPPRSLPRVWAARVRPPRSHELARTVDRIETRRTPQPADAARLAFSDRRQTTEDPSTSLRASSARRSSGRRTTSTSTTRSVRCRAYRSVPGRVALVVRPFARLDVAIISVLARRHTRTDGRDRAGECRDRALAASPGCGVRIGRGVRGRSRAPPGRATWTAEARPKHSVRRSRRVPARPLLPPQRNRARAPPSF